MIACVVCRGPEAGVPLPHVCQRSRFCPTRHADCTRRSRSRALACRSCRVAFLGCCCTGGPASDDSRLCLSRVRVGWGELCAVPVPVVPRCIGVDAMCFARHVLCYVGLYGKRLTGRYAPGEDPRATRQVLASCSVRTATANLDFSGCGSSCSSGTAGDRNYAQIAVVYPDQI